jgi:MFS family permease
MELNKFPGAQQLHDDGDAHRITAANNTKDEVSISTIHMEEHDAVKGDQSEGKVEWGTQQILATLFLCALYAGECVLVVFLCQQHIVWLTLVVSGNSPYLETGSQLPLLFGAGSVSFMVEDLGGNTISTWIPVGYSLAFASINPFGGYLQDVFGRRNISITGGALLCVGLSIVASSHGIAQAIAGMAICGCGAGIGELTALAGTSEIVPVKQRGLYLGCVTASILPFAPYPIYTTELGTHATWRWCFGIPL